MATWQAFRSADGPFARLAEGRIEGPGLVLVGTLRRNGWPRISPVEPLIVDGVLYLGMMWQSKKALDLRRDPRCTVHSIVADTAGTEGDVKVYGRACVVSDADERERYCRALEARIGWRPDGDFHLFAVDITAVGYFVVAGGGHETRTWTAPTS
jgi:hypothetical protein